MTTMIPRHLTHDHGRNSTGVDNSNVNIAKGTAMAVLFLASFTLGTLPIKLSQWFQWKTNARDNTYVKMLLGLGGGVLLCTTFLHLLPEVAESFEDLNIQTDVEIHFAELLMCIGFFVMYFVEECVHFYLHQKQKVREDMKVLRRSLSIRRGEYNEQSIANNEKNIFEKDPEHLHSDHSHVIVDISNNSTVAVIRGLLVVLALSIHELFEGLAVGLEESTSNVWYMFGAVSAHKLVIAFCIGVELVTSGLKTLLVIIYVFTFAIVSPLGIGTGIILTTAEGNSDTGLASDILQGLASGTLLYVVFFEILQADKKCGLKQYFAILLGFLIMFGLTLLG